MNKNNIFSAVVLAKNDEKIIGRCIEKLKQITDDIIIILDDRSADNTEVIAIESGARVFKKAWAGYSINKNFGIQQAINDWILCPDSDEILDDKLIESINTLKPEQDTAYEMNIMTYLGDYAVKHCGWFPDWNIRLFNKNTMQWNNSGVHEKLTSENQVKRKRLQGLIHHYSFTDEAHMQSKYEYYAKLRAEEWISKRVKPPFIKRLVGPEFRFFRTYILKAGILDGKPGWTIAKNEYILKKKELFYWREILQNIK